MKSSNNQPSKILPWVGGVGSLLLLKVAYFFIVQKNFNLFWDYPGHVQEALHTPWNLASGWNNFYFGGYTTLIYPPISKWILKILFILTNNEKAGLIIFIFSSLILFFSGIWRVIKDHLSSPSLQTIAFSWMILLFLFSPSASLINLNGVVYAGTLTAFLAMGIFLFFITIKKWYTQGLLLGILFLTHVLTASMALLWMLLQLVHSLLAPNPISQRSLILKKWIYSLLLGVMIGLPWILPFLDPRFQPTTFNLNGQPYLIGVIHLLIMIGVFIWAFIKKIKLPILSLFAILAGILSILPVWVIKILETYSISGIHFYRYYSFFIFLAPVAILKLSNTLFPTFISHLKKWGVPSISSIALLALIFFSLNRYRFEFETYLNKIPTNIQGRFLDIANQHDLEMFSHTTDHLLTEQTNLIGSMGLFFESSRTSILYAVNKRMANKDSYGVPIFQNYIDELISKSNYNQESLNDLLGINYQAYTSSESSESGTITFAKISLADTKKHKYKQKYYHLRQINQTPLIESLDYQPKIKPQLNLWDWWAGANKKLIIKNDITPKTEINLDKPPIKDIKIDRQRINFTVNSTSPVPIYLKFSYSPYWTAEAKGRKSQTSQPIWITPGNMFLYAQGEVTLTWETPPYISKFLPISLITLGVSLLWTLREYYLTRSKYYL